MYGQNSELMRNTNVIHVIFDVMNEKLQEDLDVKSFRDLLMD